MINDLAIANEKFLFVSHLDFGWNPDAVEFIKNIVTRICISLHQCVPISLLSINFLLLGQ